MNDNDNRSSAASPPDRDELLQRIMPLLGMEAADPTGRYKNQARARYLVPRIIILCVMALLIAAAAFVLLLPARFQDVSLEEAPDKATLSFRMDRVMLLESVTATLDGRPIGVTLLDAGAYQLDVNRNGELTVVARTFTDRYADVTMTIDCIDEESPHLDRDLLEDGHLYVYLTDGEGKASSGINWDTLTVTHISGGLPFDDVEIDPAENCIHFPLPDESVRIYVEDNNGNPLSLRLDRPKGQ